MKIRNHQIILWSQPHEAGIYFTDDEMKVRGVNLPGIPVSIVPFEV